MEVGTVITSYGLFLVAYAVQLFMRRTRLPYYSNDAFDVARALCIVTLLFSVSATIMFVYTKVFSP